MMCNACGFSHLRFTQIILDHASRSATDFYTEQHFLSAEHTMYCLSMHGRSRRYCRGAASSSLGMGGKTLPEAPPAGQICSG